MSKNGVYKPTKGETTKAGHRFDYSQGHRVTVTGRDGGRYLGTVDHLVKKKTGGFVVVNLGDKKTPNLQSFRPVNVEARK